MHQFADVTVYSNDKKLINAVSSDAFSVTTSQTNIVEYNVVHTITSTGALLESDLILYDVDFVDIKESSVVENILQLKLNSRHKPIVLIGYKESVHKIAKHPKVLPCISRTVTKPALRGHLDIIINHVLSTEKQKSKSIQTKETPEQSKFIRHSFYGAIAFCMVAIAAGYLFFKGDESNNVSNSIKSASTSSDQSFQVNTDSEFNQSTAEVKRIEDQALYALTEGRLALPDNDNALFYYEQILVLDRYHNGAYTGKREILKTIRDSLPQLISDNKLNYADHLLTRLKQAEPLNSANQKLTTALANAKFANNSKNEKELNNVELAKSKPSSIKRQGLRISQLVETAQTQQASAQKNKAPNSIIESPAKPIVIVSAHKHIDDQNTVALVEPSQHAVIIEKVAPKYPTRAHKRGIEGWAEVKYQVNDQGRVINHHIIEAEPAGVFDTASLRAIQKWRFDPLKDNLTGKAIESPIITTKFTYKMEG